MGLQAPVRFIVTNRSFTQLLLLIVVVAAWIKLPGIRISQFPVVELPTLMVYVTMPGASAAEIEQRVIRPVEDKLKGIHNLDEVVSDIYNGYAWVTVTYDYGVDIGDEYVEINARINHIKSELPERADVDVQKRSPADFLMSFVLGVTSGTASRTDLQKVARDLTEALRSLESIEDIEIIRPEQSVEIDLDVARMDSAGLDVGAIARAIKGNNQYLPTGVFEVGEKALSVIAFGGGYRDLDQIRDTMVINREGKALALSEVAAVGMRDRRDTTIPRVNGGAAVFVAMKLGASANIFAARREIQRVIDNLAPAGEIDIEWLFDAEAGVRDKLTILGANVLQGIGILAFVLLFAVGYRSAFIIASTLPAALFLSLIGLAFTDYGIQEISLAGFVIALGLIVDNGIVVTEHAYKLNHYGGYSHEEAAVLGTSSVITPLLSSTATTALAFAPLFLLTSDTGLFLHSLVAVIWLCLGASLVAAVVISSILIARLGTEAEVSHLPRLPSFLVALIPFRDRHYRNTVAWFIRHPFLLLAGVTLLLVGTGLVATRLQVIVFPESEDPYFTVDIEAPLDRSRDFMETLTAEVTGRVLAYDSVTACSSVQGGSFPYVNTGASRVPVRRTNAQLFCSVDFRDARALAALIRALNEELGQLSALADVRAQAFAVGSGAIAGDIEIHMSGHRTREVREAAIALERHLVDSDIDGIASIDNEANSRYFALEIAFQERRASALGVDRRSVDEALVLILHGQEIDGLRAGDGEEYPIELRTEADFDDRFRLFDRVYVKGRGGSSIPLSQVIRTRFAEDEYDVVHQDFRPRIAIDVFVAPGESIDDLTDRVIAKVDDFELPEGIAIEYGGRLAQQADAFGGVGKYASIVGLMVLAIFVFQFGSLVQPLVICAAIPLSFVGAFPLLWLTDQPMSFLAFIGLTSLMGIVINNSILLVDEGNRLRDCNPERSIREIAVDSGVNRFMPILLTSVTSVAGLLPLALGESMFKALAIVVIGGLTTSTILTLICVPVLYAYATRKGPRNVVVTSESSTGASVGRV